MKESDFTPSQFAEIFELCLSEGYGRLNISDTPHPPDRHYIISEIPIVGFDIVLSCNWSPASKELRFYSFNKVALIDYKIGVYLADKFNEALSKQTDKDNSIKAFEELKEKIKKRK